MNIPTEIIAVLFTAILALQGWTLIEIVSLKVKMGKFDDLEKRINTLENHRR